MSECKDDVVPAAIVAEELEEYIEEVSEHLEEHGVLSECDPPAAPPPQAVAPPQPLDAMAEE